MNSTQLISTKLTRKELLAGAEVVEWVEPGIEQGVPGALEGGGGELHHVLGG